METKINACLWDECPEYAEITYWKPKWYDLVWGQKGKVIFSVNLGGGIQLSFKPTPRILDLNSSRLETKVPGHVPILEPNKEPQILV